MGVAKSGATDETWRLEDPRERHERLQRYEREHRKHSAWLACTGVILICAGFAIPLFVRFLVGEVIGPGAALGFAEWGAVLLALVPVGLMRLCAACLSRGGPLRRALYRHPSLKSLAIVVMFGGPALVGSRLEKSPEEPSSAPSRPAERAHPRQDAHAPEPEREYDDEAAAAAILALTLFGLGVLLLVISMEPGAMEPAFY